MEEQTERIMIEYGGLKDSPRFEQSLEPGLKAQVTEESRDRIHRHPKVCMATQQDGLVDISKSNLFIYEPRKTPDIFEDIKISSTQSKYGHVEVSKNLLRKPGKRPLVSSSFIPHNSSVLSADKNSSKWATKLHSLNSSYHLDKAKPRNDYSGTSAVGLTFAKSGYPKNAQQYRENPTSSSALNFPNKNSSSCFGNKMSHIGNHSQERFIASEAWKRTSRPEPLKDYLDKMITENDRLLDKITKRLLDKGNVKYPKPVEASKNHSLYRPSLTGVSGTQTRKPDMDRQRQPFKPNLKHSSFVEMNSQPTRSFLEARNRWIESKSVESLYSKFKPPQYNGNNSYTDHRTADSGSSLHQRRALSKFLKHLK